MFKKEANGGLFTHQERLEKMQMISDINLQKTLDIISEPVWKPILIGALFTCGMLIVVMTLLTFLS